MRASDYRRFLRRLPVMFFAGLVIWLLLRPALDTAVSASSQLLIRAFEYPRVTRLVAADHRAEIRRSDFRADSKIPTVALTAVHFNTLILLALYLSLPRPFSRTQLERLLMGWSVLFVLQTFNLLFHVKFLYATALGPWSMAHYSALARNIYGFGRYFTDLPGQFGAPFLIWIGFNWDHVVRLVASDASRVARKK